MCAVANLEEGYAEFRLKSVFFVGDEGWAGAVHGAGQKAITGAGKKGEVAGKEVVTGGQKWENKGPMQGGMWYAHKLYTKLWMESAVSRVKS
jgi:hypothetical protein